MIMAMLYTINYQQAFHHHINRVIGWNFSWHFDVDQFIDSVKANIELKKRREPQENTCGSPP
jgi:hypothetical protein